VQAHAEVAVHVVHDAPGGERRGVEGRLFLQLADGGVFRSLTPFDLPARELPEPAEQALRGASLNQPAPLALEDHHCRPQVRSSWGRSTLGDRAGVGELATGATVGRDRANVAPGTTRQADRLAQLHQGFVEGTGPLGREHLAQGRVECRAYPRQPDIPLLSRPSGGDPQAVCLQGDHRGSEGQAGDRPSDVGADPGQRLQLLHRRGDLPAVPPLDLAGGLTKVAGPRVVACPRPRPQHLGLGRAG
jgi:hypothetical protein